MEALRLAAERHDVSAVIALFAPDIIVRSPITGLIRFEGLEQTRDLFTRVFDVISDVRFYETVGEGQPTQVIFWAGWVGPHYLEEANLLRLDAEGRIREMTVFMRPVPGLLALAAGLAGSLASRRSWWRGVVTRGLLGVFAGLYRVAEPLVVGLASAGVPQPRRVRP
jgi:SnoaL-like domain